MPNSHIRCQTSMQGHFSPYSPRVDVEASTYRIFGDFCEVNQWEYHNGDTEIVISSNFPQLFMQHFEMLNISQTMCFVISNDFSPDYLNKFSQNTGGRLCH